MPSASLLFLDDNYATDMSQEAMPPLGYRNAKWYRRTLPSGVISYFIAFTDKSKIPYRKRITLSSDVEGNAQAEATEKALKWHLGLYDPWEEERQDVSLRVASDAWFKSGATWSAHTHRGRKGVMDLFKGEFARDGATVAISSIQPRDIERFLARPGLSQATRRTYHRILNTFFRWCQAEGMLDASPVADVQKPKPGKKSIAYFTADELEAFTQAAYAYYEKKKPTIDKGERGNFIWIADLVRLAVATGLRKGAIRHLRWADVDLKEGKLFVRSHEVVWSGKRYRWNTKCSSDRVVPLFPMARAVLLRRAEKRRTEDEREPVFLGPTGRILGESQVNNAFRIVREEAKLPKALDVHACRHTFASLLLAAGESLYQVSRWLGHSSVKTTADLYGHLVPTRSEIGSRVFAEVKTDGHAERRTGPGPMTVQIGS